MSKESVLDFLTDAAKDDRLKSQLKATSNPDELIGVANQAGYDFSAQHVDEALSDLKKKPGFFWSLGRSDTANFQSS